MIAGALTAISDHEDSCTNDINHKHRVNYVPDGFLKSHAGLTLPLDLFLLVKQRNKPVNQIQFNELDFGEIVQFNRESA